MSPNTAHSMAGRSRPLSLEWLLAALTGWPQLSAAAVSRAVAVSRSTCRAAGGGPQGCAGGGIRPRGTQGLVLLWHTVRGTGWGTCVAGSYTGPPILGNRGVTEEQGQSQGWLAKGHGCPWPRHKPCVPPCKGPGTQRPLDKDKDKDKEGAGRATCSVLPGEGTAGCCPRLPPSAAGAGAAATDACVCVAPSHPPLCWCHRGDTGQCRGSRRVGRTQEAGMLSQR